MIVKKMFLPNYLSFFRAEIETKKMASDISSFSNSIKILGANKEEGSQTKYRNAKKSFLFTPEAGFLDMG